MPRTLFSLGLMLIMLQPVSAALQLNSGVRQVTLLELYTSQGCSSCPPAERWLNDHVDDDDLWTRLVPVAFHVDYWDYIGWRDHYATAANGERQRAYARVGKSRTVYTPGFFANGREWRGWTWGMGPRTSSRQPGNLAVTVDKGRLEAHFAADEQPLLLNIAILGCGIETAVTRGENRNSTLQQEFVSLAHVTHPSSSGFWQVQLPDVDDTGVRRLGLAVWVSRPDDPAPLQATGGWLQ